MNDRVAELREGSALRIVFFPVALCLFGCFLLFFRLGDRDLWASHEGRAAQNAQQLVDNGDWLLPRRFDGEIEMQKPPMYYWLVALIGRFRGGVDAEAVRWPAALAGLASALLVYWFLVRQGRTMAGFFSSLILLSAQHFTWISRTGRIDVPLTFTVTCSICCLWIGANEVASRWISHLWNLLGYSAMACGVLLKGPIAVVLPLAVLTVDATRSGRFIVFRSLMWGIPVVVCLSGWWFVVAHFRTGGQFTQVFFWYHNFERATGGSEAMAVHPWWFYGPRFAIDFLPWTPALLIAIWFTSRTDRSNRDRYLALGATWLSTILVFLSFSRFKRSDYLLPAFPGAALWLGCAGEQLFDRWRSPIRARWLAFGTIASMASIAAVWFLHLTTRVPQWDAERERHTLAAAIRSEVPYPQPVLLFRVEDHLLSYHLGRPINTFLEWENLDTWAGRAGSHAIVMPAECAEEWPKHVSAGRLDEVLRYTDRTDRKRPRDLVLMRTRPLERPADERDKPESRSAEGSQRTDQPSAASVQPGGGIGADR